MANSVQMEPQPLRRSGVMTGAAAVLLFSVAAAFAAPPSQESETPASKRQRQNREYNESHRDVVERTWSRIITLSDKGHAEKLRKTRIIYSIDETPLRIEANPGEQPVLLITTGGLRLQNVILEAYALIATGKVDEAWLFQYMLYLRQQHLKGARFHTASVAAGIVGEENVNALPPIYHGLYLHYRQTALFFSLAHEAAHLVHDDVVEQADKESDKAFEQRMQRQETRADKFAVDMMTKQAEFVSAFSTLLLSTLMIYEPRDSVSDANLHIPDRLRMRVIAGWVRDAVAKNPRVPDLDRSMINGGLEQTFKFTDPMMSRLFLLFRDAQLQRPVFDRLNLPSVVN